MTAIASSKLIKKVSLSSSTHNNIFPSRSRWCQITRRRWCGCWHILRRSRPWCRGEIKARGGIELRWTRGDSLLLHERSPSNRRLFLDHKSVRRRGLCFHINCWSYVLGAGDSPLEAEAFLADHAVALRGSRLRGWSASLLIKLLHRNHNRSSLHHLSPVAQLTRI